MKYSLSFLLLFITCISFANVELPAVISDNMVLQQQSQVLLWGNAKKNASMTITTSWNNKTYTIKTTAEGNFKTRVQTPVAGGPYKITFNDGEKKVLGNVLIGEVWLCSGQSNMEMPVRGFSNQPILNSNDILLDADKPGIRLFRIEKNMSKTPLTKMDSKWEEANAANVKEFSAVGYQFARMLQEKLNVPVGVIQSAYGGTDIEAWMTTTSLQPFNDFKRPADTAKIGKNDPQVLFNAMINPIVGYTIKGTLWYQGENNRKNPFAYDKKMEALVSIWRKLWDAGNWPFYYVQIAPFNYADSKELVPVLQEKQFASMALIPNSGMAATIDIGSSKTIHPSDKTTVARRLLYWALANDYGKKGIAYKGPVYKTMQVNKDTVTVAFDNATFGYTAFGKELISFEVAGADKIFYPAKANITGKGIVLLSEQVKTPVAVRYGFKDYAPGNLYNTEGLPAYPFRTDSW
ncbi:MAG: sialate O-acetylesterase [Filimonas sp.]|nr:sialate O-acetylesterase [Filimonas sp.]